MSSIRVADYIAQRLAAEGLTHVFMVTGGGAMHLNDAFGREKGLSVVCCHHEQACSMAAEAYTRLTGRLACVNVTTGPGGTNAITGVYGAHVDSIGMIVVSGQVKYETVVASTGLPLRQLGDQEVDIIPMVKGVTKYAVMVTDPQSIRYHLERALHLARSGRPGPCWLDVPINVQAARIDPAGLKAYDPAEDQIRFETVDLEGALAQVVDRLHRAQRPVLMAGTGMRVSGMAARFDALARRLGIPVAPAWNSYDLLHDGHPAFAGRPGTIGDRAGNFTVQNADALLVLGCRLNIRQISYNWKQFAPHAWKAMVDVDAAELKKPTLSIDLPVHAALESAMPILERLCGARDWGHHRAWLAWCRERVARYPVVLPEYWKKASPVNPYCFVDRLFDQLRENEVVVCGDGTACVTTFQAAKLKPGQRLWHNSGCAAMGYDLPAALGAAEALGPRERVVCIAGDGSMMMNLQELQTIAGRGREVKLFVLNNQGYHSIRQTQAAYFPDNEVGCGTQSGVTFPDFSRIAAAFGMPFRRIERHDELEAGIRATLGAPGAAFCEIVLDLAQSFSPKLASRMLPDGKMTTPSLEDMAPFLERGELAENLFHKPEAP